MHVVLPQSVWSKRSKDSLLSGRPSRSRRSTDKRRPSQARSANGGRAMPWCVELYALCRAGWTTLAHRGARAYGETFDLVHRREASRANAIWQVDHAQLDIRILLEDGSTARPWLTVVIDDYSRAVAGYYLGCEPPSSLRTALALRQGIWRKGDPHWEICGIPDTLYTDNGADFTSKHIEQVAVDLKTRLVFSTPGQPQLREIVSSVDREVRNSVSRLDSAAIRVRYALLPWGWLLAAFLLGMVATAVFGYYRIEKPLEDTWNSQESSSAR